MRADRFGTLSQIRPDEPQTWENRVFLTLDIDWACDGVLSAVMDLVEAAGVPATWFVTHETPLLARLRAIPQFELGIHPNFNKLLQAGDPGNGANAEEVLARLKALVPEAVSTRSHAVTQSGIFHGLYQRHGLTHESNTFVPFCAGVPLKPWVNFDGLVKVPFFWEDDIHHLFEQTESLAPMLAAPGLKVFSFHPIHVFLNSPNLDRYEASRPVHQDAARLVEFVHPGVGVKTYLSELLAWG
jgi:hypothetical protein